MTRDPRFEFPQSQTNAGHLPVENSRWVTVDDISRDIAVRDRADLRRYRADKRRAINRSADTSRVARRAVSPTRRVASRRVAQPRRTQSENAEILGVAVPSPCRAPIFHLPVGSGGTKMQSPRGFALKIPPPSLVHTTVPGDRGTTRYHLTNTRREPRAAPLPFLRPLVVPPIADPPRRAHTRRAYPGTSDARGGDRTFRVRGTR